MEKNNNPIFVTQPALPPLEEFTGYLEQIWDSKILTNNGPFHQQFEQALADYLGVKHISLFANGTLALMTALQALRITGEVITTPFSFAATTHSLWWNKIQPVFVDIEPETFTLDPEKAEAAITPQTTAIMPVHVYGNPCKLERLQEIADIYGLKLIYDSAHTFGVKVKDKSLVSFGDLSILSFHATKVFNTIEGGAIICPDKKTKKRIDYLKNFGFAGETTVIEPGINAKMNEIQAAYGLLQLKYVDEYIARRKTVADTYRKQLEGIPGIHFLDDIQEVHHNYAYFPILVNASEYGKSRDELYEELKRNNIYGRRYFYPLISQFPTYRGLSSAKPSNLPVAEKIAAEVICLPIYPELALTTINKIMNCIKSYD
ncbi:dTDP-4-amino-4,6-dideoxygalactose transaminase [Tangfeifania diversioriginum]|uniref:dTDP-4-amino-4,6-dideoxygalactose transaminase n=1 Tax=Tangfeifania diversioriginum TaxID=1168035 RepID=A0A1M6LRE5_9BACT|nr:DegT/DnrJ/EryC1/StrS family aminotransferase [Tangfeifania diversioriginum]SHJ73735.1 dTDP-4-amino-4,6-dideoxygalactose transaminase [Tangfeifania diversioriginum]